MAEHRFEPPPTKKELFQIIPMHMMTTEIIPGRKTKGLTVSYKLTVRLWYSHICAEKGRYRLSHLSVWWHYTCTHNASFLALSKVNGMGHCIVLYNESGCWSLIMAALWNRAGHYIFALWFFPCLISAAADWMSTILRHVVSPYCEFRMQVWRAVSSSLEMQHPKGHHCTTLNAMDPFSLTKTTTNT